MANEQNNLAALAAFNLRLGFTAFGGPAAHIALMEQEVVGRRGWFTKPEFLELLGMVNLIPGPSSTQLAIFIGYRKAGWLGLLVAGCCFIFPAAAVTLALAYFYVRYGKVPATGGLLHGLKPVVIAIILHAIWSLGRTAISNVWRALLAVAAFAASLLGCNLLLVLLVAGLVSLTATMAAEKRQLSQLRQVLVPSALLFSAPEAAAKVVSIGAIFLRFLKLGAVVFGSGYTLVAFLRADLVDRTHWLTSQQLLDAITVGQITPGPVFTTATFIGFLLGGVRGATAATVAIFLPSFLMVAAGGILLPRLQKSRVFSAFIAGVSTASLALMAAVLVQLTPDALVDPLAWVLCLGSAFALFRYNLNSSILVAVGAAVGLASTWLR